LIGYRTNTASGEIFIFITVILNSLNKIERVILHAKSPSSGKVDLSYLPSDFVKLFQLCFIGENPFQFVPYACHTYPWSLLETSLLSSFQLHVYSKLCEVPYGVTWSYSQLASGIGKPLAVRAVGTALRRNPFPILFPCHRIIKSDGESGEFSQGVYFKKLLLYREFFGRLF